MIDLKINQDLENFHIDRFKAYGFEYVYESLSIFKFILVILLLVIPFLIYKISKKLQKINNSKDDELIILSISLILSVPAIFGKNLFSIVSLFGIPIVLLIYYFL